MNHIFYTCIMDKKKKVFTEQANATIIILPLLRQCLMYALMITSSQLKLLVHALFYVLPIWRKETLRVLTNYLIITLPKHYVKTLQNTPS